MIPVAVSYFLVGTVALLMTVASLRIGTVTMAQVVHYYLTGFATLLIYALGTRLLTAFFTSRYPGPSLGSFFIAGLSRRPFWGRSSGSIRGSRSAAYSRHSL